MITVVSEEVTQVPEGPVIVATGPLTSDALSRAIGEYFGQRIICISSTLRPRWYRRNPWIWTLPGGRPGMTGEHRTT